MRDLLRQATTLGLVLLLAAALAPASVENERTNLTVHEKIEVPGAVLEPGEYTLELMQSQGTNQIVLFRGSDGEPVSTALAIPAQRNDVTGNTKFAFYEASAGDPPALRTWFFPGKMVGHEFAYPETRGKEIAQSAGRNVPTVSDAEYNKMKSGMAKGDDEVLVAVHEISLYSISPEGKQMKTEEGRKMNERADAMTQRPDQFVTSKAVPETRLERQVRKEIVTLPFYSIWDHIEFRVSDSGEVALMGSVYRPSMKKSVERVVSNVEGVKSVKNNIEILPTSTQDDDIRQAAYASIYGHPALQPYQLRAVPPIHIIVDNGNLTLEGVVQNQMDKNVAGIQANSVNGVFSVENNLRVQGGGSTDQSDD